MTEKTNYVDNKQLYEAICEWKKECREKGEIVKQNDVIGAAIMAIANGLTKRFNFSNYTSTWKEEMIGDGVEMSIKGLINFDETKYKNPHAYITQACFNAYLQRLKKEKKQTAVKYSYFIHNVYDSRDPEMASIADENFIQDIYDKMAQYESSIKTEKEQVEEIDKLSFLYEEEDNESTIE